MSTMAAEVIALGAILLLVGVVRALVWARGEMGMLLLARARGHYKESTNDIRE